MRENVYFLERGNTRYNLSDKWRLTRRGGFGLVQPEYMTKANSQFGERFLSYRLPPRILNIGLHRRAAVSQAQYWDNRAELLELFTPTVDDTIKFVAHLATGQRRAINVRYDSGLDFPTPEPMSARNISVDLSLIAYDPMWYNPFADEFNFTATPPSELSFTFDFPKTFDSDGGSYLTSDFAYDGNSLFRTYPQITLNGPFESAVLTNVLSGVKITLVASVAWNESRIITLGENTRSVVDGDGNNRFFEVDETSNLIDFYIAPNVGAGQLIQAVFVGGDLTTSLTMSYNKRYIGI